MTFHMGIWLCLHECERFSGKSFSSCRLQLFSACHKLVMHKMLFGIWQSNRNDVISGTVDLRERKQKVRFHRKGIHVSVGNTYVRSTWTDQRAWSVSANEFVVSKLTLQQAMIQLGFVVTDRSYVPILCQDITIRVFVGSLCKCLKNILLNGHPREKATSYHLHAFILCTRCTYTKQFSCHYCIHTSQ